MQILDFSQDWGQWVVYAIVAGIGATLSKLIDWFVRQRTERAQVYKTDAETLLVQAQADDLEMKTEMTGIQMLREMNKDIIDLEREMARLKNENQAYEKQLQWAKGVLKDRGFPWDDVPLD